jgi:hypothetical protein
LEYGTEWETELARKRNPIGYDKYHRRVEYPVLVELYEIWKFMIVTVRDNQTIGAGAMLAAFEAEFPTSSFDFVNLFTWIIEENTQSNTWAELRQIIIDNLGNFDTSEVPYKQARSALRG